MSGPYDIATKLPAGLQRMVRRRAGYGRHISGASAGGETMTVTAPPGEPRGPANAPSAMGTGSPAMAIADPPRTGQLLWFCAAVILGVVSLARGLHLPNSWAATQALFDYSDGLMRRGLYGATLGHWLQLGTYARFVAASGVWLAVCFTLLLAVTWRLCGAGLGAAAAVSFGGFSLVYLGALIGYSDVLLVSIAATLICVHGPRVRLMAALPLCLCGMLLHEMFLVVFLPVILLAFAVDAVRTGQLLVPVAAAVLLTALCGLVALALTSRTMTADAAQQYRQSVGRRADFRLNADTFLVLTRSLAENRSIMTGDYDLRPSYRTRFATDLGMALPQLFLVAMAAALALGPMRAFAQHVWLALCFLLSALSPLAMHLVAWDEGRFDALAVVTSCLALAAVAPLREDAAPLPRWYRAAAVLAIAVGMLRAHRLIDGEMPNRYPFAVQGRHLLERARTGNWKPVGPDWED